MKPLTVYKASAGSGKTFTLATQYISLVIENPQSYRNILAVTFTNKATEEMKMRILSQLYGIANQLDDSKGYLEVVMNNTELSETQVVERAGVALSNLIHNYNYFRVETIDTFFQSVLRNLARELDLTANLRIGLNDYQIEEQAVDELIESLDTSNRLLYWIMDYINDNIADDKSWNVIGQIKKFGQNIFKDFYKDHSKQLDEVMKDENFFKNYTAELKKKRKEASEMLTQFAETFFDLLDENGFSVDDFSNGKTGICGYFLKLRNGVYDDDELLKKRVTDGMQDPEKWVKKKDAKPGNPLFDLVTDQLFNFINLVESKRPLLVKQLKSADLTLKHLNQLRLLHSIEAQVRSMNETANRFLLSDTQNLLHSLIKDSDSPFIFEKIGTQLEHVMIDEFQDTSMIQWKNFKVLLQETMSHNGEETASHSDKVIKNMIVGDVKQSIYRWRSGDWRLLNNINEEFPESSLDSKNLAINFRSDRNIINFNNHFFENAAKLEVQGLEGIKEEEAKQLITAYEDVKQGIPEKKEATGLVSIKLLTSQEYQDDMMELTMETVDHLIEQGVKEKNIAILVRSNRTNQDIADYFMENRPERHLVSDEAFRLDASVAVNVIISALRYVIQPENVLAEAYLKKAEEQGLITLPADFIEEKTAEEASGNSVLKELAQMPLFDLVEKLFRLFELEKLSDESAYVCAFYDQLSSYLQDNTTDIASFLNEWDNSIHQKTIQSDEINGIRLITIHKSKGLEFDNVIMPFCDWQLEKSNTLWCQPEIAPYNQLPLVPIDFAAKSMKGSIYEQDYYHEHLQNVVDNLNLLYVAFTRAGRNLFVYGKRGNANQRSALIENVVMNICEEMGGKIIGENDSKLDLEFDYGVLDTATDEEKKESSNVFIKKELSEKIEIKNFEQRAEFRQSNKSRDFIEGKEEDNQKQFIKEGTILHNLFSTIRTVNDVPNALKQLELDGVLYDGSNTPDRIKSLLRKRFESPIIREWFSDKWTIYNECTILHVKDGKVIERRPDRVMTDGNELIVVDFKFGKPNDEYHKQVREYMHLLKNMGHENVKGYLWFVYKNDIVEVKEK